MDVVHALSSFPNGPPGKGEWDREEAKAGHWRFLSFFPDFIFLSDFALDSLDSLPALLSLLGSL